jgi:hypothetical protein
MEYLEEPLIGTYKFGICQHFGKFSAANKQASKQHQQSEIALISRIFSAMMNCCLQNSKNKYICGHPSIVLCT